MARLGSFLNGTRHVVGKEVAQLRLLAAKRRSASLRLVQQRLSVVVEAEGSATARAATTSARRRLE